MNRPPPCPRCGEPTHELNEVFTAGTQGTAQCARCGAVFTYLRDGQSHDGKHGGDGKPHDKTASQLPEQHDGR